MAEIGEVCRELTGADALNEATGQSVPEPEAKGVQIVIPYQSVEPERPEPKPVGIYVHFERKAVDLELGPLGSINLYQGGMDHFREKLKK